MLNLRQNEQDRSNATTSLRLGVAAGRPRSWNNMLCLTRGVRVGFPRTQMWLARRARCSHTVKGLASSGGAEEPGRPSTARSGRHRHVRRCASPRFSRLMLFWHQTIVRRDSSPVK